MSDAVYVADIRIDRIKGPYRHAWLPAHEGPVEFGVHGAIKEHYGADPDREITGAVHQPITRQNPSV